MVTLAIAALIVGAPVSQDSASAAVSKMLARYAEAKSLVGTVRFSQSLGQVVVVTETAIQYERPNKLFIRQQRRSVTEPRQWLVTADAKYFSYDAPDGISDNRQRLIEGYGPGQDLRDAFSAASRSMGDRDAPIIIAISRPKDLQFLRNQWASIGSIDPKPAGSDGFAVVGGQWREFVSVPSSGTFEMWITPEGDLKRYVRRETLAAEGMAPQLVLSVWDVFFEVNGKTDPALFEIIR